MKNRYYSLAKNGTTADITIYGDITSWAWEELGEMSAVNLSRQLDEMEDVERINVYINSYGGEVAEGLAIYNALRRHKAEVVTYCDGFACSIASVIFMAGSKRIMNEASLLMIHNAWTFAEGNADQLRKQADDLETITNASVAAYLSSVTISEEELREMMDAETWLEPSKALEYGFCTDIEKSETQNVSQNARKKVQEMILNPYQAIEDEEEIEEPVEPEEEPTEEPETTEEPEEEPQEAEGDEEDPEEPTEDELPEDEEASDEEEEVETMQYAFFKAIQRL